MYDAKRESYLALQQYKADLQRSKIQLRRDSNMEPNTSLKDFQDRGRSTEQDRGSIERARRGSDGDNARSTKIKCSQELAPNIQPGPVEWDSKNFNHSVNQIESAAETNQSAIRYLVPDQFMSYPMSAFAGSAVLREDPNAQQSKTVRFDEPSTTTTTVRVPSFARQIINRSSASGDFVHHRDTFAIARSKRGARNIPRSTALPRPIVANLVKYIDHQTYLSLRFVSRSWSQAVDHVKPPQYPAVYRVPTEVIQQIFYWVLAEKTVRSSHATFSVNNFNNARHSCRAWMAASLDKQLLTYSFVRGGLESNLSVFEARLQDSNETDEDDLAILWEMSLQLARCCKSTFLIHRSAPDGASRTL